MRFQAASACERWTHLLVGVLAVSLAGGVAGCGGGTAKTKTPEEARKELEKLKKEKPKPPFDPVQVVSQPNERTFVETRSADTERETEAQDDAQVDDDRFEERTLPRGYVKPGHWTGVLLTTTANDRDFVGELVAQAVTTSQQPIDLENTSFRLMTARPAALPKSQRKTLEATFFAPPVRAPDVRLSTWIHSQFRNRRTGAVEWTAQAERFQHMPSYQYYLYVLAREPSRYRFLKVLDSVRPPLPVPTVVADDQDYYRVLTPRPAAPLALPARALAWTCISHVVWDEMLPATLSPEQQQAMLDWLHWGGHLVISGPRTLDMLQGSFLEPYLPATAAESIDIDAAALEALNQHWSIADADGTRQSLTLSEPLAGIRFAKHAEAEYLPGTGELVVERRAGRGRVVATAFRLAERSLLNWRSFDGFVNACLLRRLPRRFNVANEQFQFVRDDGDLVNDSFDAAHISHLRVYSRDAVDADQDASQQRAAHALARANELVQQYQSTPGVFGWEERDRLEVMKGDAGVAGWNDFSAVPDVARQTLRSAAGISVPNRRFVLWMIGVYLLLVVPVNWLVFRIAGRVEWAWAAVPVLAVGWGLVVVWLAQLDIGFARAETEVAVLEAQGGYSRAHLTRFMALYTSLSTTYDVHFDDPSVVALPFARDREVAPGEGRSTVMLRSEDGQRLSDLVVSSNSTEMIHSEQFVNLNGAFAWRAAPGAEPVLENNTRLALQGAVVVRRRPDAQREVPPGEIDPASITEAAWLGTLDAGATTRVRLMALDAASDAIAEGYEESEATSKKPPSGALNLRALVDLATDARLFAPGDVRLVGWYDAGLPGAEPDPAAAQARRRTLVVVNLEFGDRAAVRDENLRVKKKPDEEL